MKKPKLVEDSYIGKVCLPLTVVRPKFVLVALFAGLFAIMLGFHGILYQQIHIYFDEIDILFLAKIKKLLMPWIWMLGGAICLHYAFKNFNPIAKFIVNEDSVELFLSSSFGLRVSDSKEVRSISVDKDYLSIRKRPTRGVCVSLHLHSLEGNKNLIFNAPPSFEDASKFALNLQSLLKLKTPIKIL